MKTAGPSFVLRCYTILCCGISYHLKNPLHPKRSENTYTLLQKKVYTLFCGEYSKYRWRRTSDRLDKLPIRVLHQLVLDLWQNSKWLQSSKEKFIGKSCRKVHKNLFLPLISMLLADKVHAFQLCFTTLKPLWILSQTQFCLDWNFNELPCICCHGSYMA